VKYALIFVSGENHEMSHDNLPPGVRTDAFHILSRIANNYAATFDAV
jgi:hypothetical protein